MHFDGQLLLALTTAHLLADFVLQSDKDIAGKKRLAVQAKHTLVVAGLSYLLAGDWRMWVIPVAIGLTHFAIDRVKLRFDQSRLDVFVVDQTAHLLVIGAIAWSCAPVANVWAEWWGAIFAKALVVTAGLVLTVRMGGMVIGMLVQPYLDDLTKRANGGPPLAASPETERGLAKGGFIIGELERGLIFFFVMIARPEAVAFLVAAKSIFRFGELKDRRHRAEAEYITIGTLMSFTWGLVSAWITWWIYRRI